MFIVIRRLYYYAYTCWYNVGFEPMLSQTNDLKMYTCRFLILARYSASLG